MGYIYFEGGPLDGTAYETKSLLGPEALNLPVTEYVWTSDTKTSSVDPSMKASVWKHRTLVDGAVTSKNGATVVPPGHPVQQLPQSDPLAVQPTTEVGSATATQVEDRPVPFESVAEAYDAVQSAAVGASVQQVVADPSQGGSPAASNGLPTGTQLFERRKAMKLSVSAVVDACGGQLAHSKIGSIEKGTGKRVKEEEVRLYAATLDRLEAERGGASAHS